MVVKDCPNWVPHVTVATIVEKDGQFLFVEEWSSQKKVLNQPAGHVERGESILEAAIRETKEETGWLVEPTHVVAMQRWHKPFSDHTFFRFSIAAKAISHDSHQRLDDGIIQAKWLSYNELIRQSTRLRSPLVRTTVESYLSGKKFDLSILEDC